MDGTDKVNAVVLEDGTSYLADVVVVACSIRENTSLAVQVGIAVNKAVIVNEKMATNVSDIYACAIAPRTMESIVRGRGYRHIFFTQIACAIQ